MYGQPRQLPLLKRLLRWFRTADSSASANEVTSGLDEEVKGEFAASIWRQRAGYLADDERRVVRMLGTAEHDLREVRRPLLTLTTATGPRAELARNILATVDSVLSISGGMLALVVRQFPSSRPSLAHRAAERCMQHMTMLTASARQLLNAEEAANHARVRVLELQRRATILSDEAPTTYGIMRLLEQCSSARSSNDVDVVVAESHRVESWLEQWEGSLRDEISRLQKLILMLGGAPAAEASQLEDLAKTLSVHLTTLALQSIHASASQCSATAENHARHLGSPELQPLFKRRRAVSGRKIKRASAVTMPPQWAALHAFQQQEPKAPTKRRSGR